MLFGIEFTWRFFVKLGFGLLGLYLIIIFQTPFIMGLIWGMLTMSYIFLFPTLGMRYIMDKMFDYSNSFAVVLKNESEENKIKINKESYGKKVKFKD